MKTLISGSMAYDSTLVFQDQFKNHILPDQVHMLNVSFYAPEMRRYDGGCAGNIAYTLKLLGGNPAILAAVGDDFTPYAERLEQYQISQEGVKRLAGTFTAQAYILNDTDNNQITAFHPGAMSQAHEAKISDIDSPKLAIVSPNGRDAMIQHAQQLSEQGIPFFFDPGQALPLFNKSELEAFFDQANYAIMNDYESHLVMEKMSCSLAELASKVEVLIITKGGEGSQLYHNQGVMSIPSAPISKALDPTGCGDAYRAGVLYGLSRQLDWKTCAQIGSLCGAIKIELAGTQKHHFTLEEFAQRYENSFSEKLDI